MSVEWRECNEEIQQYKDELEKILPKYVEAIKESDIKTLAFLWRRETKSKYQLIIEIEQQGKRNHYLVFGYPWYEDQPNDGESIPNTEARTKSLLQISINN